MTVQNSDYKEVWEILQAVLDSTTDPTLPFLRTSAGGGGGSDVTIHDPTTPAYKMKVNADGSINAGLVVEDIEIGAVEIKNGTTDDRVVIKTDGADMAMVTQNKVISTNLDEKISDLDNAIVGSTPNRKSLYDVFGAFSTLATAIVGATAKTLFDIWTLINGISFATSTKQSDGSQKTQVVDGSANVIGSTGNALDVNVKSGNITGFALETGGNLASVKTNTDNLNGKNIPVVTVAATSSGDTIIRTPTSGKKTRVRYIMFSNAGTADVVVYLKSATTGNVYQTLLKPGAMFATAIGLNNNYHELAVNEVCYVNLSVAGTVYATIRYEEV